MMFTIDSSYHFGCSFLNKSCQPKIKALSIIFVFFLLDLLTVIYSIVDLLILYISFSLDQVFKSDLILLLTNFKNSNVFKMNVFKKNFVVYL